MLQQIQEFGLLLLITGLYAVAYSLMRKSEFGFKDAIDPIYFSFTTMSTVGYGDLSPRSRRAKILVMSHQMILLVSEMALILKYIKK